VAVVFLQSQLVF